MINGLKLSNQIQRDLIDFARGSAYDIVMCNYYFGSYEMDVFKLNDKHWVTEYEIKISKADFKKDFNKQRSRFVYEDKTYRNHSVVITNKHEQLISGECSPNRFYFVVPDKLINVNEVPAHCGLIYYKNGRFSIVKVAKLLHKKSQPVEVFKSIARSLSFRESRYRREVSYYQYQAEQLNKQIIELKKVNNVTDTL